MKHLSPIINNLFVFSILFSMLALLPIHPAHAGSTKMPDTKDSIMFIENVGQFNDNALFQVRGSEGTLWLAEDALWVTVLDSQTSADNESPAKGINIKLSFPGSNPHPLLEPFNRFDTHVSFLIGSIVENWYPDVPVWGGVRYRDLYPGVDLEITGANGQLVQRMVSRDQKYLERVHLSVEGAGGMTLDGNSLLLETLVGEYHLPLLQVSGTTGGKLSSPSIDGNLVSSPFSNPHVDSENTSLRTGANDLIYSTFLGGTNDDQGYAIAVDSSGAAYVTGSSTSSDFPTNTGSFDPSHNGYSDAFVVKLNASGSALDYATFLGGIGEDKGNDISVDTSGAAYVTGYTGSSDFPYTVGAYDENFNGGAFDAFLVKLSTDGSALSYATFLGGSGEDKGNDIAIDIGGFAYVTGQTGSSGFSTPGAYDESYNGGTSDAFVAKLNTSGSALVYATYLGGSGEEYGNGIDIDTGGKVYVIGDTNSTDFPVTTGGFDTSFNGGNSDAFVIKLSSDGSALSYATYIGGNSPDFGNDIAINSTGGVFVTGTTNSNNFPITPWGFDVSYNGYTDVYLLKLNTISSTLDYATYMGEVNEDNGNGITVDANGFVYSTGKTCSPAFPTTVGAYDVSYNPGCDAFVLKLSPSIPISATFRSTGLHDGWILESSENSKVGGTFNSTYATLNLGDNAQKKQFRAVLSFNTASLPNNAVIIKATLKLKRQGVVGGINPITTFQGFMVDIKKGAFGMPWLQATDWQTAASKTYGPFTPALAGGWYNINLTNAKVYINKFATNSGLTQIRLRFKLDDNNNGLPNYLRLYSGNAGVTSSPRLVIEYYVP